MDENQLQSPEEQSENPLADLQASKKRAGIDRWSGGQYLDVTPVVAVARAVRQELAKVIIGQADAMDQLLIAVLSGGHVLIEGVPGIAKTLMSRLMAKTMDVEYSRIQFTPDLMPADVVGTSVFNQKDSEFTYVKGPIFANFVLIDEINRAPAKTQAALFEVMEERQVTVDGTTRKLDYPFFVMATQNPIEQEGTYKLPEAQLDRFVFKINLHYPDLDDERRILRRFRKDFAQSQTNDVNAVLNANRLQACADLVENVFIKDQLLDYIALIVHETRVTGDLYLGASPRASLAIMKTAKAAAALAGRDFVVPDDIQYVANPVLNHRIILAPEREMEGLTSQNVIDDIVKRIDVPR